jgi:hypothetical protein
LFHFSPVHNVVVHVAWGECQLHHYDRIEAELDVGFVHHYVQIAVVLDVGKDAV